MQPGQRFCERCGKEVAVPVVPAYPVVNRVQEHVKLLAILWLALGLMSVFGGFVLFTMSSFIFSHMAEVSQTPHAPQFLHMIFMVLGMLVLAKAALELFAGWGLLKHAPWARILTIVAAFLGLLNIPFGTALGIYSLWVLLPAQSERDYAQFAQNAIAG